MNESYKLVTRLFMIAALGAAVAGLLVSFLVRLEVEPVFVGTAVTVVMLGISTIFIATSADLMGRLEAGRERTRAIVETAADGIITTDEHGIIQTFNTAAETIFGYHPGEVIERNITLLLSSQYDDIEEAFGEFLLSNDMSAVGTAQEAVALHRKGRSFPIDLSIGRTFVNERQMFTVIVRDITERKAAQLALRGAHDELEVHVRERTADLQQANDQLNEEVTERLRVERDREKLIRKLQQALNEVKALGGLIPICAACKKIRDDQGYWNQIEVYLREHSDAEFSHSLCPDCMRRLYPELKFDD